MDYLLPNKTLILWLFLPLFLKISDPGQEKAFVKLKEEPEYTFIAGQENHIQLSFLIREGYHIQAYQVKDENLIPSELTFEESDTLIFPGDPVFPEAVEFRMKGTEEAMDVYSDLLEIKVPLRTFKYLERGAYLIKGKLHYQACDDVKCYFPRDLPFTMKINIEER